MDAAPLYSLYDAFAGDRHTFLYSGQFLDEHTARLITLGEGAVGNTEADKALRARLAFVLVEAYQNIIRHRPAPALGRVWTARHSMLLLRSGTKLNEVSTVNPVRKSDTQGLLANLAALGALDREQLKARFLETLQRKGRTRAGGAGLGLIEMARRSGNGLRHGCTEMDAEQSCFSLSIDLDPPNAKSSSADDLRRWLSHAAEAGLTLFCKGLDHAVIENSLLRIIDQETADDPTISGRSAPIARAGLDLLNLLGGQAAQNAVALLQHDGSTTIGLLTVLPVQLAEQASSAINAMHSGPPLDPPLHRTMLQLVRLTGAPVGARTGSCGEGKNHLLIIVPVAVP